MGNNKKPAKQTTLYHVMRESIDYHNDPSGGSIDTEVRGSYTSLSEANEAARSDLLNEWGRDFFDEYEEEIEDGKVKVHCICPEGEEMNVFIEIKEAAIAQGVRNGIDILGNAYIVTQRDFEKASDKIGKMHILGVYCSQDSANSAAKEFLYQMCDIEDSSDEDEIENFELKAKVEKDGLFVGKAYVRWDDVDNIIVKAEKWTLHE